MIKLSLHSVKQASANALICINPDSQAFVLERQPDGGVDDPRIQDRAVFFPVLAIETGGNLLEGGDWTTIPYVRRNGVAVEADDSYQDFEIEWVSEQPAKIIYHQVKPGVDCPDGIASAWVARKVYPEAEIIGCVYQGELPKVEMGDRLIIVDFSFPQI